MPISDFSNSIFRYLENYVWEGIKSIDEPIFNETDPARSVPVPSPSEYS